MLRHCAILKFFLLKIASMIALFTLSSCNHNDDLAEILEQTEAELSVAQACLRRQASDHDAEVATLRA
jgi:hypothetical protein